MFTHTCANIVNLGEKIPPTDAQRCAQNRWFALEKKTTWFPHDSWPEINHPKETPSSTQKNHLCNGPLSGVSAQQPRFPWKPNLRENHWKTGKPWYPWSMCWQCVGSTQPISGRWAPQAPQAPHATRVARRPGE